MLNVIRAHYEKVEDYFRKKKQAKFIVFDIEKDALDKLREFIDIPEGLKLPHAHKSKGRNISKAEAVALIESKSVEVVSLNRGN